MSLLAAGLLGLVIGVALGHRIAARRYQTALYRLDKETFLRAHDRWAAR